MEAASFTIDQVQEKLGSGDDLRSLSRSSLARRPLLDMVRLPGGEFTMGSSEHYPEEAPARRVVG